MIASFFSSSILNLGLRGLSMLAKFLLVIYIGKYLTINELGEYGLFVTTITIAIYFLGLDFYTYNTREILAKEKNERLPLIRDQFIFHLLVYVIVLPLLLTIFSLEIINTEFMIYFYLILVFEHLAQELFRLYTTLQQPIFANFLLFMRTGLWVYVVITLWYLNVEGMMNLKTVWYGWTIGSFLSIIIGITYLRKDHNFKSLTKKVDWIWIKNGVKISVPFFIGTLAYKVIEFSDRYMIDYYMSTADVGIYTFFGSIANTMQTIVFTLVIMIYYPKMIELYKHSRIDEFNKMTNKFFLNVLIYSTITIMGIVLFIYPVLEYLDKAKFVENLSILWILLAATLVLNLSFVPHYILFVKHKDILIRNITLIGAGLNIVLNVFMIQNYGLNGAAVATATSFGVILLIKYIHTIRGMFYE